jgi:nucleotide-binding universal stress UspA family protein
MIEKILVGTVESSGLDATVEMAAELACSQDAELVVLRVDPLIDARQVFDPAGVPIGPSPVGRLRRRYPDLRLRSSQVRGHALRAVTDAARQEQPDLIVVGHGRRSRNRALLSQRASKALVQQAPCAVLLVAS